MHGAIAEIVHQTAYSYFALGCGCGSRSVGRSAADIQRPCSMFMYTGRRWLKEDKTFKISHGDLQLARLQLVGSGVPVCS